MSYNFHSCIFVRGFDKNLPPKLCMQSITHTAPFLVSILGPTLTGLGGECFVMLEVTVFCLLFYSTNWCMLLTCMCCSLMFKDLPAGCWMPKNNEQQHPGLSKETFLFLSRCILALEFAEICARFYGDNTAFHLKSFTCLITFLLLLILAP